MRLGRKRAEAVLMKQRRFNFFPQLFVWHGRAHRVVECERSWTESRWRFWKRTERRYFRVCCTDGTYELCHDLLSNTWHILMHRPEAGLDAIRAGARGCDMCEAKAAVI